MRVRIAGQYYDLDFADIDDLGLCDHPKALGKRIRIRHKHGSDLDELDTTIHECLHASAWWLDEEYVSQFAEDIARILWRLGWRKTEG